MSNITEVKPKKMRDPQDTLADCKAYTKGDFTSIVWCRRNRGEWCKTNGKRCQWSKV